MGLFIFWPILCPEVRAMTHIVLRMMFAHFYNCFRRELSFEDSMHRRKNGELPDEAIPLQDGVHLARSARALQLLPAQQGGLEGTEGGWGDPTRGRLAHVANEGFCKSPVTSTVTGCYEVCDATRLENCFRFGDACNGGERKFAIAE